MTWAEIVEHYGLSATSPGLDLKPRFNIAPTQRVPVVRPAGDGAGRALVSMRWGFTPEWATSPLINARAGSVRAKRTFQAAFEKRRCLIVADGFYEWQPRRGRPKQPYFITVAGDRPFAFAGLWEAFPFAGGERRDTCTIITTEANATLAPIHGRMPAILEPAHFGLWLDTAAPAEDAEALLRPYGGEMTTHPVSSLVNKVDHDESACRAEWPDT